MTERKAVRAEVADGLVTAVIATTDVRDHDGDVLRKGAIPDGKEVPICIQHSCLRDPRKVGMATTRTVGNQVLADLRFNMKEKAGRAAYAIASSPDAEYSWGFRRLRAKEGMLDGHQVTELLAVDLCEISVVLVGASIGTGTLSAKCHCGGSCRNTRASEAALAAEKALLKASTALAVGKAHDLLHHLGPRRAASPSSEADRAVRVALKCAAPEITHIWISPAEAPGLAGRYRPTHKGRIEMVAHPDRGAPDYARTALHEVGHALGIMDEPGADRYAVKWLGTVLRAGRATNWRPERIIAADIADPGLFPVERRGELDGKVLVTRRAPDVWEYRLFSITRDWHRAAA